MNQHKNNRGDIMNWRQLLNTKISDGRTVFEFLFGNGIVEVDEGIMDKSIGDTEINNVKQALKRDGLTLVED